VKWLEDEGKLEAYSSGYCSYWRRLEDDVDRTCVRESNFLLTHTASLTTSSGSPVIALIFDMKVFAGYKSGTARYVGYTDVKLNIGDFLSLESFRKAIKSIDPIASVTSLKTVDRIIETVYDHDAPKILLSDWFGVVPDRKANQDKQ
jgi:hypothetical protein